jgi:hypothetical protein
MKGEEGRAAVLPMTNKKDNQAFSNPDGSQASEQRIGSQASYCEYVLNC